MSRRESALRLWGESSVTVAMPASMARWTSSVSVMIGKATGSAPPAGSIPTVHPLEELVEERHGERRVSVGGAVQDPLGDQRRTAWRDRLDTHTERCGDVPGAMRSGAKRCHGD